MPVHQVHLADPDPSWPEAFAVERTALAAVLPARVAGIEHVGSTAIPGLAAKPIIDIAVLVGAWEDAPGCISPIVGLGYVCLGEAGIPGRLFFRKPTATPLPGQSYGGVARTHHIHLFTLDHAQYARQVQFRDRLRADPRAVAAYDALKRSLAALHPDDVEAYAEAKSAFILGVIR